jgi:hypothetical protein
LSSRRQFDLPCRQVDAVLFAIPVYRFYVIRTQEKAIREDVSPARAPNDPPVVAQPRDLQFAVRDEAPMFDEW